MKTAGNFSLAGSSPAPAAKWNMIISLFKKQGLGIDIGSFSIKIVELSKARGKITLVNYIEIKRNLKKLSEFSFFKNNSLTPKLGDLLQKVLSKAKIKAKRVVFTLPDFSIFFTWFELPPMKKGEIPGAVRHQARRQIPFPLNEVTLDWEIIEGTEKGGKIKILLVVVSNQTIDQYLKIANSSQLQLSALEAEVFALARAFSIKENIPIALVDIGFRSSTCSILDKRVLKRSYSFDISAGKLTDSLANSLKIDYNEAEELKKKYNYLEKEKFDKKINKIFEAWLEAILQEIKRVMDEFYQLELKPVQKIILSGGGALLAGLKECAKRRLKKEVEIINPFLDISYPQALEPQLKILAPSFAIAIGAALRSLK